MVVSVVAAVVVRVGVVVSSSSGSSGDSNNTCGINVIALSTCNHGIAGFRSSIGVYI